MTIKVLLIGDRHIDRLGLRDLIDQQPDMEVFGEAQNQQQAIKLIPHARPDVVVIDITGPDLNSPLDIAQIRIRLPDIRIIALSIHHRRNFIINMLNAGISGLLLKSKVNDDLPDAVRDVAAGKAYFGSKIASHIAQDYANIETHSKHTDCSTADILTPRDRQVLQLIADGQTANDAALKLNVSIKTIEVVRRQIMQKLDIHSIAGLTKYAVIEGLTPLED